MASRLHQKHPSSSTDPTDQSDPPPGPWWRNGWLWVVIGSLVLTLAAAVATTLIAMQSPDEQVEIAPGERPAHAREANP